MANKANNIFSLLLCHLFILFCEMAFYIFCIYSKWIVCFLSVEFWVFSYSPDTSLLLDIWFANILYHSVASEGQI